MKNLINKLSKPLDMTSIDWRVKIVKQKGCTLVAYKDARVDMNRLDDVCGAMWCNEFKRDSKGVLQCGIGIYIEELKKWCWRWSNGAENLLGKNGNDPAVVKGEYSDAFKRAGFMWGIGRELYDVPFTWCNFLDGEVKENNGKFSATFQFKPNEWVWEIDYAKGIVSAKDKNGNVRVGFSNTSSNPPKQQPTKQKKLSDKDAIINSIAINHLKEAKLTDQQKRVAAGFIYDFKDDQYKRPFFAIVNEHQGSAEEILEILRNATELDSAGLREYVNTLGENKLPF